MLGTSEGTLRTKIRQRALIAGVLTDDKKDDTENIDFENLLNPIQTLEEPAVIKKDVEIESLIDLGDEFEEVEPNA